MQHWYSDRLELADILMRQKVSRAGRQETKEKKAKAKATGTGYKIIF